MSERRHPHVVNVDEVPETARETGKRYGFRRRQLGAAAGGQQIGCSWMELPPGKRAWPAHWHGANEEAIYVLSGRGRVRIGDAEVELRPGDWVALPKGPGCAHQTINDGDEPLRYLCVSTMIEPDVGVYPDSGKVGVFVGAAPGGDPSTRTLWAYARLADGVDYWDGEDTD